MNGQMIPADIFSTATDNESLDPHSYPWAGDNVWGSLTAADGIQELNLLQGWNHLVFQFDTSDTASANNKFQTRNWLSSSGSIRNSIQQVRALSVRPRRRPI